MRRSTGINQLYLLLGAIFLFCPGCGEDYPSGELKGRVTVDGRPLELGTIHFTPLEGGRGPTVSVDIKADGNYHIEQVPLGKNRVVFHAIKETGNMLRDNDLGIDYPETVSLIAPKFHLQGIEVEVESGAKELDFQLTSK